MKKFLATLVTLIGLTAIAADPVKSVRIDFAYAGAPGITIYKNAYNKFYFELYQRGAPIDLTGVTDIWASWATSATATVVYPATVTVVRAESGLVEVVWEPNRSSGANPGYYLYEIGATAPTGVSVYIQGTLRVVPSPYASGDVGVFTQTNVVWGTFVPVGWPPFGSITNETDPIWTAEKTGYIQTNDLRYISAITNETDPIWTVEKVDYVQTNDLKYVLAITNETDPIWTAEKVDYVQTNDPKYVFSLTNESDTLATVLARGSNANQQSILGLWGLSVSNISSGVIQGKSAYTSSGYNAKLNSINSEPSLQLAKFGSSSGWSIITNSPASLQLHAGDAFTALMYQMISNAPAAMQIAYGSGLTGNRCFNEGGGGSLQVVYLHNQARTNYMSGRGSIGVGYACVTNDNCLVVGSGAMTYSKGAGTITCSGGFYVIDTPVLTNQVGSFGGIDRYPTNVAPYNLALSSSFPIAGKVTAIRAKTQGGSAVFDVVLQHYTNAVGSYTTIYTGVVASINATGIVVNLPVAAGECIGVVVTNIAAPTNLWYSLEYSLP